MKTKAAHQLQKGDRIAFLSGQCSNYTGHNKRVPMESTIVRIVPYEATKCVAVQLAGGLQIGYYWDQAVTMASDDRTEQKPLAAVQPGLTVKGVSLE